MFGQLPNTKQYLKRVKDAGGTIRNDVQLAINNFTKKVYQLGLRSTNSSSHIVKHCNIFPTEAKTGSNFNLWFIGSAFNHTSDGYTYSLDDGASIFDKITTSFNTTDTSTDNGHMGWFVTVPYDEATLAGFNNAQSDRFMCHPNGYGGFYLDFGNDTFNDGRSLYSIPDANMADTLGLGIATKLGSSARHVLDGAVVKTTTLSTNLSVSPGVYIIQSYNDTGSRTDFKMSGFTFGSDIPNSKLADYTTAWNTLQSTISQKRSPTYLPPAKLIYDATDVTTVLDSSGNQVSVTNNDVNSFLDKSGLNKTLTATSTGIRWNSTRKAIVCNTSVTSYLDVLSGFYFGTIAFVLESNVTLNRNTSAKVILGHSGGGGFNAVGFGSKTSWLVDEVFWLVGDGRLGLVSSSLSIPAGQKFIVLLSWTGLRTGNAQYNSTFYAGEPSNQGQNQTSYQNVRFCLLNNYGTEQFDGYLYEFRNYSEAFSQNDLRVLYKVLAKKHNI